jgi:flagellar biosynthesis/type III secretory pathway M-ring protein FliF/YscJ
MATWVWIVIAVGVVLLLGLLGVAALRSRTRRLEERREQAQELRREAETRTQQAEEREQIARRHEEEAREARKVAAEVGARADRLDPDRETPDEPT